MGETENIAKMAEKLSKDLFKKLLWGDICGPINQNWPCVKDHHDRKTHPTDVVFEYAEPYDDMTTIVICDLKSYAKASISATSMRTAIENLSKTIECAEVSEGCHSLYKPRDEKVQFVGLLFVYNHDGVYDSDFRKFLPEHKDENFQFPSWSKIFVLGPKEICYLNTVCVDIWGLIGDGVIKSMDHYSFYYPDLEGLPATQRSGPLAANLELIFGPWLILNHKTKEDGTGIIVYYKGTGEDRDDFFYLFDYLLHYQQFKGDSIIEFRMANAANSANANFESAKKEYIKRQPPSCEFAKKINEIRFSPVTNIVTNFSEAIIGMSDER